MRFIIVAFMVLTFFTAGHAFANTSNPSANTLSEKSISATITAYTADPRENGGPGTISSTAIGTPIRSGIVAVSRDLLRSGWDYGSKVHIKGLGVFIIEDTMHERHRRTIDVAVPNVAAAQKIGKMRDIEVTLLEEGTGGNG